MAVPAFTAPAYAGDGEAQAIVRRSVAVDREAARLRRNYTFHVLNRLSEGNGAEAVSDTNSKLEEVLYIGGEPFTHLLEKNGRPLPASEAAKERQKLDRAVREATKMTDAERQKRTDESLRKSAKQREDLKNLPEAFDFTLDKDVEIAGRPAWQIRASPRRDYRGPSAFLFRRIEGTLWIDKADYAWVKADAITLDTISLGLFLMRLSKGSRLTFENMKVNGEVWVPKRVEMYASARLGLIKKFNAHQELTFSDYRRFQTDSRLVGGVETTGP